MAPLLECRGLRAGHGRVTVVRPIDLAVDAGTVLAVLGPNGAGKTTLLSTIVGLLPRQGGEVLVGGKAVKAGRPDVAGRAGIVPGALAKVRSRDESSMISTSTS